MPDGVKESLDERMSKLLCKIALLEGIAALHGQANLVASVTWNLHAANYYDQSPSELFPIGFNRIAEMVKPRITTLLNTLLPHETISRAVLAFSDTVYRAGIVKDITGQGADAFQALAEKCRWTVNSISGTTPNSQLITSLRNNPKLLDVARKLWGNSNMSPEDVVRRGIALGTLAQLHNVKQPLIGLLMLSEREIVGVLQRVEHAVDQELLHPYLRAQTYLSPEQRRIWREQILADFWADRTEDACQFQRRSWYDVLDRKRHLIDAHREILLSLDLDRIVRAPIPVGAPPASRFGLLKESRTSHRR